MHLVLFLFLFGDGARPDVPAPKAEEVPRRYRLPPPPPPAPPAKPKKETAAERKKRLAEEKRIRKMLEALSGKDGQQMGLIGVLRSGDSSGSSIFGSGDLSGSGFGSGGLGTGTAGVGTGGGGKAWGTIGIGTIGATPATPPPNDREAIHRVVRAHTASIKYCYEKELAQKPDLAGRVSTRFKIDETGAVTEANVTDSTLGDTNVESCVLRQIRSWKFPAKATTVTYPFRFETGG
jgi:TonB family protein